MSNVKLAIVRNDYVDNIIVAKLEQKAELEAALHCELVYEPYINLAKGDKRINGEWTRNVDGVATVLTSKPTYAELEGELLAVEAGIAEGVNSIVDDE